jgi:hypothetical protein
MIKNENAKQKSAASRSDTAKTAKKRQRREESGVKKKTTPAAALRGTPYNWMRSAEDPPIMTPPKPGSVSSARIRKAIKEVAKEQAAFQRAGSSRSGKTGS